MQKKHMSVRRKSGETMGTILVQQTFALYTTRAVTLEKPVNTGARYGRMFQRAQKARRTMASVERCAFGVVAKGAL